MKLLRGIPYLVCVVLLSAACAADVSVTTTAGPDDPSPEVTPASDPDPEPTPEQPAEPTPTPRFGAGSGEVGDVGTYGTNPEKDELYDACADGDMAACDELYEVSSSGTEYELFGGSCGEPEKGILDNYCVTSGPTPVPQPEPEIAAENFNPEAWMDGYTTKMRDLYMDGCVDAEAEEDPILGSNENFCSCSFQFIAETIPFSEFTDFADAFDEDDRTTDLLLACIVGS